MRGKEVYETKNLIRENKYSELDTELITKEQALKVKEGMNYEQVCEIFGSEGKAERSKTTIYSDSKNTYEDYVWRCRWKDHDREYYYELNFDDGIIKDIHEWRLEYIE